MFDNYADYMYSLLTAPLKQVKKASNQFYLFFKVVGALYDQTVQDIQRVREESMVATASEIMLTEHGRDRNMPRLDERDPGRTGRNQGKHRIMPESVQRCGRSDPISYHRS